MKSRKLRSFRNLRLFVSNQKKNLRSVILPRKPVCSESKQKCHEVAIMRLTSNHENLNHFQALLLLVTFIFMHV